MDRLRRAFDNFDRDRSGNINTAELAAVLAHIGKPQRPEHMGAIVRKIKLDYTFSYKNWPSIDLDQKNCFKMSYLTSNMVLECFRVEDSIGGKIQKVILFKMFKMRDADNNNSGKIEFNEFVSFIVRQHLY